MSYHEEKYALEGSSKENGLKVGIDSEFLGHPSGLIHFLDETSRPDR